MYLVVVCFVNYDRYSDITLFNRIAILEKINDLPHPLKRNSIGTVAYHAIIL